MADLYSINGRAELQAGSPLSNWVWTQQQFSLFYVATDQTIDTQTKANTFGYSVMEALQPVWACFPSRAIGYGWVLLEGGQDAATVKATLEDQAYVATAGDSTFTVTAATGCWNDGNDLVWDEDRNYKIYDDTYSYFNSDSVFHDSNGVLEIRASVASADTQPYDDDVKEWLQIISAGQNWNGGNWRDGTGRETNFPYDLPLTNSNIALIGLDHDTADTSDIEDTDNAYYNINSNFETILSGTQPLGYSFVYEDEAAMGLSDTLGMFVDLSRFDPIHLRTQFEFGDAGGDVRLYCTSLDFVYSGGTDTDS